MSETITRERPLSSPGVPALPNIAGFKVEKVSEQDVWLKMFIWGLPGVGKTRLAGSALEVEEMCPVLFLDIEGGTLSLRDIYGDIDRIKVADAIRADGTIAKSAWKRVNDVFEVFRKESPYKTYVIDNLSELQKLSMVSVMRDTVMKDSDRDIDVPAQRDWGKSSEQIRRMVRSFRDLPAHVIFTGWEARKQDQMTGVITLEPSLPGKLAGEVPGYLDLVLYMYAREQTVGGEAAVSRFILTQPTKKVTVAKDRSGRLPVTMENPTMAQIMKLALG